MMIIIITSLLKQFLKFKLLNDPYTGGLGSYCLVLLMISFLQLYSNRKEIDDCYGAYRVNLGMIISLVIIILYLYTRVTPVVIP
jgi:DNA polymerase sigma